MKTIDKALSDLKRNGYSVLNEYFDKDFCKKAIEEINDYINLKDSKVITNRHENVSGDYRMFGFEKVSETARKFKNDNFINSIIKKITNYKHSSHFILAGKLEFETGIHKNSGGGWHRDSDKEQFKYMVYLNDVDEKGGPFLFLKNSDNFDLPRRIRQNKMSFIENILFFFNKIKKNPPRYENQVIENDIHKKSNLKEIIGKAGTVVIFDSTYIHRGKNIEYGSRYTFTNYIYKKSIASKIMRKRQFKKLLI